MYTPEEKIDNYNSYKTNEVEKLFFKYKLRNDPRSLIAIIEMKEDFLKLEEYLTNSLKEKIANQNGYRS